MAKTVKEKLKEKLRQSKAKQGPTVVNFILDKSGSMGSMTKAVISGFNEYVDNLRKEKNMLFSFTLFDSDEIEQRYIAEPIATVVPLDNSNYVPGSATPLYDAVCGTVEEAREKLDKQYPKYASLVVIMTDGMENASSRYTMQDFIKLKKELEAKGNWTFVFMGANQDAWATAQSMGLSAGNAMSWSADDDGVKNAMRSLSQNTVMYAASMSAAGGGGGSGVLNTDNFFNNGAGGGNIKGK